jgi:hypothetical protein
MTFSFSPALFKTWLKMSKANALPDSISATWSWVRSIGTGSVGSTSLFLLHDINVRVKRIKIADNDPVILLFIMTHFTDKQQSVYKTV